MLRHAAFPPLATGVLVEAGGFQGIPGERIDKGIEAQQILVDLADFLDDAAMFAAFQLAELPLGVVEDGERVADDTAAEVNAVDVAVDPHGTGVIAAAVGAFFPGHEGALGRV